MTTEWAHLPNAVHIDRVIASAKANPTQWVEGRGAAWNAAREAARGAAWSKAWNTVQDAGRSVEYNAAREAAREAAWNAARSAEYTAMREAAYNAAQYFAQYAILALVAYDDCAHMLDSDPGELAILAAFGDPRAILLLLACTAFHSLKTNA
jgi:hypothetical protein